MTVQRILDTQQGVERSHIAPDAKISDVLSSLAFRNVGALVVSMIGIRDLLQLRLTEVQSEADAMRSYILGGV